MSKKLFFYFPLFLLLLCSCEAIENVDELDVSFITYDIDGENMSTKVSGALLRQEDSEGVFYTLTLTETKTGEVLQISIANEDLDLIGTYDIGARNGELAISGADRSTILASSLDCPTLDGTISITEQDLESRTIGGTFSGTICSTLGSRRVSNGQIFGVRYVEQN